MRRLILNVSLLGLLALTSACGDDAVACGEPAGESAAPRCTDIGPTTTTTTTTDTGSTDGTATATGTATTTAGTGSATQTGTTTEGTVGCVENCTDETSDSDTEPDPTTDSDGSTGSTGSTGPDPTTSSTGTTDPDPTDGSSSSSSSTTGNFDNCVDLMAAFNAETQAIRSCNGDDECGQVLPGTSCGCTRNWVARLDANTDYFYELVDIGNDLGCEFPFISSCDCPATDGFLCDNGICNWNYL